MRGKHAARSANKQHDALLSEIDALRAALDEMKEVARAAFARSRNTASLEEDVVRMKEELAANTSDEIRSLRATVGRMEEENKRLAEFVGKVRKIHDNAMVHALSALGGGKVAIERLTSLLSEYDIILVQDEFTKSGKYARLISDKSMHSGSPRQADKAIALARHIAEG